MSDAPVMLEVAGLGKVYRHAGGDVTALEGVDLSVRRGEFVAVTGCSGSGKTTFLNLVGGLERPTAGAIRFKERCLTELDEAQLADIRLTEIGFVFQDFCLVSGLHALDNIRLPLYLSGRLNRDSERARSLLEEVGLETRATHFPWQLSRGEMQRVAIARALVCDPDLLLVDEPSGNLDAQSTAAVQAILDRFCRQMHKTIILATHDPALYRQADRVVELSYGRLRTGG